MRSFPKFFVLAATLVATPAIAAPTARPTANLPILAGPGVNYDRIGTLAAGSHVPIDKCTRGARWCFILNDAGPDGWVLGSYLVGAAAKLSVQPYIYWPKPDFHNLP